MAFRSFFDSVGSDCRETIRTLRTKTLSIWSAGILIAFIALIFFLWQGPWGVSAGYRNWGDWFFYSLGLIEEKPQYPWLNGISLSNIGIFVGALVSALLNRDFNIQAPKYHEYLKAAIGGVLMGFGAVLSRGCNVGGFYSAIGMFSLGGYLMMIGLVLGAYLGLRYLIWETYRLQQEKTNSPIVAGNALQDIRKYSNLPTYMGVFLSLLVIILFDVYSEYDHTIEGGHLFFGFLLGIILHRSRFCFIRAFRCPFMTGEAEMVKVVALSFIIYGAGTAVIKWLYIQPVPMGTYHSVSILGLAGGTIFGTGMVIAGACATSTLWRLGEGNTKLLLTLCSFSLTNSIVYNYFKRYDLYNFFGNGLCIPEKFGWQYTFLIFLTILFVWIMVANWNEKHENLVVF